MKNYSLRIFFSLSIALRRLSATILLIVLTQTAWSQTISYIDLPNTQYVDGSMAMDIVNADGCIFVYSMDGIKVLSEIDNSFVGSIDFGGTSYGKYNSIYFNSRLSFGDGSVMAVNAEKHILYVVFPDLRIHCISTITKQDLNHTFNPFLTTPPEGLDPFPDYFAPLHGGCILKYDNIHNRLYWVIFGRDPQSPENHTGEFHAFSRYFGIFNADQLSGYLAWYYTKLNEAYTNDDGDYYDMNISDVEYNDIQNDNDPRSKIFYLSKFNSIEVWAINPGGIGEDRVRNKAIVNVDNTIYGYKNENTPNPYKFGNMLYVHNSNVHQIIALPYKYPGAPLVEGKNPLVYVLDASWIPDERGLETSTFIAPSEKISDGLIIHHGSEGPDDLVLCYSPDIEDHLISGDDPSDVAIYRSNPNLAYVLLPPYFLTEPISLISNYDINTPFKLIQTGESNPTILIGKKDGISKIVYNGSYHTDQVISAESNYFINGLRDNQYGKSFIVNSVANGIEVFNNNLERQSIPMGFPVYNIVGNGDGSKLYFFNTLQANNTGLYVYENGASVNVNYDEDYNKHIEKSIGDCIFNPFKNQFLISEYADFGPISPAIVKVLAADGNNSFVQNITLADNNGAHYQFPKEMFISPEGKLYVMVNMHMNINENPPVVYILEFSADDQGSVPAYSFLNKYQIELPVVVGDYDCYAAHFSYNPTNRLSYVSVSPTELTLDPYNTVVNSMFDFLAPTDDYPVTGSFVKISNDPPPSINLYYPGKVICPDAEYPDISTQFKGEMYIIGNVFCVYNVNTSTCSQPLTEKFNDITYSPYEDKMFAIRDVSGSNSSQRFFKVFSIYYENSILMFHEIESLTFPGQATCIKYNPYDGKVYIYKKIDDAKLGAEQVKLLSFDPGTYNQMTSINCTFRDLNPELDHNPDHHFYFYNITEPYLDPIHNFAYFPNGANSSVTKMSFANSTDEAIPLDPSGFTWLSFPRLLSRIPTNPTVNAVLQEYETGVKNIVPFGYEQDSSWLINLPPQYSHEVRSIYNGLIWPSVTGLMNIDSKYGYKLRLYYNPEDPPEKVWLHMHGTVLPATTQLTIYRRYDNWIGYWLYETQSPLDALPSSVLDQLTSIIAQNWTCGRYSSLGDGNGQPSSYWLCACHEGKAQLRYGDMVILRTVDGTSNINFQWQRFGNPVTGRDRPETEHFLYTEQAEYAPYLIELDSTQLPKEIGAFVNDTCVGATAILPGDTLVLIPGYIEGMSGEVSFEMYYDSLKAASPAITEYFVENPKNLIRERRTIYTSEKQDYFLVSFKEKPGESYLSSIPGIMVIPNPATERCSVVFTLPQAGKTSIDIVDLFGRKLNTLLKGYLPAGNHRIEVNLRDTKGNKISEGVYLIQVNCGQFKGQSKLILLQ
jgi:hypothetical protein